MDRAEHSHDMLRLPRDFGTVVDDDFVFGLKDEIGVQVPAKRRLKVDDTAQSEVVRSFALAKQQRRARIVGSRAARSRNRVRHAHIL